MAPTPTPTTASNKRIVFVVLGIVALFGVAVVVGFILLIRGGMATTQKARVPAEAFLTDMERHDYRAADALLTPQSQAVTPVSHLADIGQLLEKERGREFGHSKAIGWYTGYYNGRTIVRLTFQERFANGSAPVTVVLMQTPAGWQVQSFNYQI